VKIFITEKENQLFTSFLYIFQNLKNRNNCKNANIMGSNMQAIQQKLTNHMCIKANPFFGFGMGYDQA
jgi:hypothetical protein